MTKKEQAEMDSLREQLRISKALRFTDEVKPDVQPPAPSEVGNKLRTGFQYHAYGDGRVSPACTSSMFHSVGNNDKTTTQGGRALYSTRLLALKAMRHDMELECAKRLAAVDALIEKELATA